jgi:hypothetical protein
MNVFLRRKTLFAFLLALGLPLLAGAQMEVVDVLVFQGQTYRDTFVSQPNAPSLLIAPSHGTLTYPQSPQYHYNVAYTPSPDFIGQDVARFRIWKVQGNVVTFFNREYRFTVMPSRVVAVHDNATTSAGQPVTVNVLQNDSTSNGTLILKSIPLVNNGTATMNPVDSTITFTPAPGFQGIAYLNYVACDDLGSCDNGTVSISVLGENGSSPDTIKIFTRKNQPQFVFVPNGYILTGSPAHGIYGSSGGVPVYTPDLDYVGFDYILYDFNGDDKVVQIKVLDLKDNAFAFDDRFYITPFDGQQEFNVLANDLYGIESGCVQVFPAQYGSVQYNPALDAKGVVRYSPAPGFTGVDWFTYSICEPNNPNSVESATVYVFVSNFEPSASTFYLSTPKETPLIIGYSVPISQFSFAVEAPASLGAVSFLPGPVDTVIYGQQVTGFNIVLYTPGSGISSGQDDFELRYCVLSNGACAYERTVKVYVDILDIGDGNGPMCFDDCVWPGDTNFDGAVDMEDLLPLGLRMGEVGRPRPEVNLNIWYGQYGDDWNNPFQQLYIDLKHLDTDGDSLITALDTFAISQFYGKARSLTPVKVPYLEYEIILEGGLFASPGDLVELQMKMGDPENPAHNVYGFTFPFQYAPDFVVPNSVAVEFDSESWLAYSSPMLKMSRDNQGGLMDVGFTRTNGIAASGHGQIGTVSFIVTDDLAGFRPDAEGLSLKVGGGMATTMTGEGMTYGVKISEFTLRIVAPNEVGPAQVNENQLKVFPNPTNLGFVNVHLNGGQDFERIVIHALDGRQVFDSGRVAARRMQVPVSQLHEGLYILSAYTPQGLINKKIQVMR